MHYSKHHYRNVSHDENIMNLQEDMYIHLTMKAIASNGNQGDDIRKNLEKTPIQKGYLKLLWYKAIHWNI